MRPPQEHASDAPLAGPVPAEHGQLTPQRLAEAQQRFLALSPDLLAIAAVDGHFLWLNPAWETVVGFPPDALIGRHCFDLVHPDDRDATRAEARQLAASGQSITFRNRYRCADDSYRWLAWSAAAADGVIYAVARDISAQRQTEEALLESEGRYRTVIAALDEGVIVQDAEGRIVTTNPGVEHILGLAPGSLLGLLSNGMPWEAIREDGSPIPRDMLPAHMAQRTGQPQSNVAMGIRRRDRAPLWLIVNSRPLIREGK